ncbi:MAG: hypothetical protein ACR2RV_29310 [Verrucomicrobiales bacterium]
MAIHYTPVPRGLFVLLFLIGMGIPAPQWTQAAPPKLDQTPIEFEVSTSSADQKKLMKIFAAVNESCGGDLSKEEFVRRLKAREHFEVRYPVQCRVCNGWKRLIPDRGKRGQDGKVDCKICRGKGIEMRPHIIVWKSGMLTHLGDRRDPILAALIRKLGDQAGAQAWYTTARSFHTGEQSKAPNARAYAHAAYQRAIAKANAAWRPDQPTSSDHNKLHRHIIDESLAGIAATAPKRGENEPAKRPTQGQTTRERRRD